MMSTSTILVVLCLCCALSRCQAIQELRDEPTNRIAGPGEPQYYLMADAGSSVGPNDALKRTNRSLLKWWDDLFGQNIDNNNNNNNNYNNVLYPTVAPVVQPQTNCNGYGLQLQDLDPFKQMKLFKKMPDLFGNPIGNCGGLCGGNCGQQPLQPQINYVAPAPPAPGYGGDDGYAKPNPDYNGPGDGDAGYVAPVVPPPVTYDAPVAPPASYEAPAPSYEAPAPTYEAPAPSAPVYDAPAPVYDAPAPPAPSYEQSAATPDTYGKVADYSPPASNYPAAQPPQIVYQPIIYVSAPPASRTEVATKVQVDEQSYNNQPAAPVYEAPTPPAAPVYEAPLEPTYAPPPPPPPAATPCGSYLPLWGVPVYNYGAAQPAAPPAAPPVAPPAYAPAPPPSPGYATPSCATPIRLSLIDQPYRVAPELFEEYHYRLGLAAQNRL
ncbi:LOW QUALITY PROTEIN: proline-rich extensin-like protein EPR1 [Drosophila obscura]|uniref:LOW QUALITY PROTEIN: proline-rich extensin-like protein EPR1 n=1 Tax=Drosophila obscura TaxID=7282 RepID=UPI001BB0F422|nr:LOW QUALITY PROTEIN: proline-rich extensin-like protein EPR1 [Drosophila obscura]